MIAAIARDGVIGSENDLPWRLSGDLRRFKELTTGHTVIMGRKTFDSIAARLGGPLPNRRNVVITRNTSFSSSDVTALTDPQDALKLPGELYVIGGAQIFELMMDVAERLYITDVHAKLPGDAYFPAIDPAAWREVSREKHQADEKNEYDYDFVVYERI